MIKAITNFFAKHDQAWWAKIGASIVGLLAFGILFLKYNLFKSRSQKAELENVLVDDDKQDSITKAKVEAIDKARQEALDKANKHQNAAQQLEEQIENLHSVAKTEQEIIHSIKSWDDLDAKIKDK